MINIQHHNVERITRVALTECRRQETDFRGLIDLLSAYEVAEFASNASLPNETIIRRLGELIEPTKNANGYRRTPVTFQNGGSSCGPLNIMTAMWNLVDSINDTQDSDPAIQSDLVDQWVKWFLWIHPFADGNGRVAWILYNWLRGTMSYPLPLPKYDF